ncbi:MAG: hypothetical protein JWN44_3135 [Myxococcales bacterium]|nr:hypothetical protein [Myxococcales bacterium]
MSFRTVSMFALACAALTAGCRDNGTLQPADLSGTGGGGDGGTAGGDMATGGTKTYTMATVAAMRQGAPGDYQLTDVVAIGLTPSSTSPHLFVQDAGGGDYTAIKTNCSSTSTSHPCQVSSTVKTVALGHKVTVKGTFIKSSTANGGTEDFYIDSITDNGAGTAPATATVMLADVIKGNGTAMKKLWFQHVTVMNPGTLVAYDLSPPELAFSGATKCPYQLGFAVAPMGTTGAAAALSCADATTQPATATAPDAAEIYIGTDFFKDFNVASDCRCTAMFHDKEVTATSTATALSGILVYDTVFGSMPVKSYLYVSPLNTTDLALTNLTQR